MDDLRPERRAAALQTIVEAFADDPLLAIIAPDPVKRARIAPAFLDLSLAYGLRYGQVWANDDASAVAIWIHPESGSISTIRMLRAGLWQSAFSSASTA